MSENVAIASINGNGLKAPVNVMCLTSGQRFTVFDVPPQNERSFVIDDTLHVIPSDKFAQLQMGIIDADGGLRNRPERMPQIQKIEIGRSIGDLPLSFSSTRS